MCVFFFVLSFSEHDFDRKTRSNRQTTGTVSGRPFYIGSIFGRFFFLFFWIIQINRGGGEIRITAIFFFRYLCGAIWRKHGINRKLFSLQNIFNSNVANNSLAGSLTRNRILFSYCFTDSFDTNTFQYISLSIDDFMFISHGIQSEKQ